MKRPGVFAAKLPVANSFDQLVGAASSEGGMVGDARGARSHAPARGLQGRRSCEPGLLVPSSEKAASGLATGPAGRAASDAPYPLHWKNQRVDCLMRVLQRDPRLRPCTTTS